MIRGRIRLMLAIWLSCTMVACEELPTSSASGTVILGPGLLNPLQVGDTILVTATGLSSDGPGPYALGTVTWSSDDPAVASITPLPDQSFFGEQARARVVAVGPGTTLVRVDTRAGQATMEIPVEPAIPSS